jgi:hypothetical protein
VNKKFRVQFGSRYLWRGAVLWISPRSVAVSFSSISRSPWEMPFCAPDDLGYVRPDLFPSLPIMGDETQANEEDANETQASLDETQANEEDANETQASLSQSLSGTCFAPGLEEGLSTDEEEEEEEETQAGRGGGGAKQEHPDRLVSKQEQEQERRREQEQEQKQQQQQEQAQKKIHIHLIEDKWEYSDRLDLWQARTLAGTFQWIPTSYTFADPFDTPPKSHHVAELVYATTTATTSTTGASSSGKRKREEKGEEEKERKIDEEEEEEVLDAAQIT